MLRSWTSCSLSLLHKEPVSSLLSAAKHVGTFVPHCQPLQIWLRQTLFEPTWWRHSILVGRGLSMDLPGSLIHSQSSLLTCGAAVSWVMTILEAVTEANGQYFPGLSFLDAWFTLLTQVLPASSLGGWREASGGYLLSQSVPPLECCSYLLMNKNFFRRWVLGSHAR